MDKVNCFQFWKVKIICRTSITIGVFYQVFEIRQILYVDNSQRLDQGKNSDTELAYFGALPPNIVQGAHLTTVPITFWSSTKVNLLFAQVYINADLHRCIYFNIIFFFTWGNKT